MQAIKVGLLGIGTVGSGTFNAERRPPDMGRQSRLPISRQIIVRNIPNGLFSASRLLRAVRSSPGSLAWAVAGPLAGDRRLPAVKFGKGRQPGGAVGLDVDEVAGRMAEHVGVALDGAATVVLHLALLAGGDAGDHVLRGGDTVEGGESFVAMTRVSQNFT